MPTHPWQLVFVFGGFGDYGGILLLHTASEHANGAIGGFGIILRHIEQMLCDAQFSYVAVSAYEMSTKDCVPNTTNLIRLLAHNSGWRNWGHLSGESEHEEAIGSSRTFKHTYANSRLQRTE